MADLHAISRTARRELADARSAKDADFAGRLYSDPQANHVRVWYFPEDARWGRSLWGEIDQSIKIYDKLVVMCSENSLQSGPALREIARALNREDQEAKEGLFLIRIDDYIFKTREHPLKAAVLAKVVGDFSSWHHQPGYKQAFDRFLACLGAGNRG